MAKVYNAAPIVAAVLLPAAFLAAGNPVVATVAGVALIAAVFAAVHHAEVVAHKVGEPYGTLILSVAVTVIEAALLVSLMLSGGPGAAGLVRDSLFAAVMIIITGVIGLCMFVGGWRHGEPRYRREGITAGLATLITLATLVLVLPSFTTSTPGPTYSSTQLIFVAAMSLAIWAVFVFVQTVRHRDYFLPPGDDAENVLAHAAPPTKRETWTSFGLLMVSLAAVVGLAKALSPWIEAAVVSLDAPVAVIGIAIALLVLLPETVAAARAARANRMQTSLNLAIGSAIASVGLTIPTVVAAAFMLDLPLELGLDAKSIVILSVTFLVSSVTLASGRTNMMEGAVHLVLFAAYLFLSFVP